MSLIEYTFFSQPYAKCTGAIGNKCWLVVINSQLLMIFVDAHTPLS